MIAVLMLLAQLFPFPGGVPASPPYSISNSSGAATGIAMGSGTSNVKRAMQFLVPAGYPMHVTSITINLAKAVATDVADNVVVELWTNNATGPKPSTLHATSTTTLVGSTLTTTRTATAFSFASVALTANTSYWIVVSRSGSTDASNYYSMTGSTSGTYADGGMVYWNNSVWSGFVSSTDMYFTVAGVTP